MVSGERGAILSATSVHRPELESALAECRRRSLEAGSTFHFALRLLPEKKRQAMFAVYYFCRRVDDAVDEPGDEQTSRQLLNSLKEGLNDNRSGKLWTALNWVRAHFSIPEKYFYELIAGAELDLGLVRIPTFERLENYCYHVAGTVGLITLHVFGEPDEQQLSRGKHLARAFQLTNILRDVEEDHGRDRCYLPIDLLKKYSALEAWKQKNMTPGFRHVLVEVADRARESYQQALPLLGRLNWRCRLTLALMTAAYSEYLRQIEAVDYAVWSDPVKISGSCYPLLFWRGLLATLGDSENCLSV